ncbi:MULTISPECIES: hypothetical protein [unclassified Microbacterium]|uniref:hypothetical protein n=1 Tax=unclassified Microbacterium TaxID=2609290 RepID=UPI00300FB44E
MSGPTGGAGASTKGAVAAATSDARHPAATVQQQEDARRLVLAPLCDRSWRLCDRALTYSDPASVIAYVEELEDGTYEAVWVSVGLGFARYPSLEPLLADAIERVDSGRSLGALKPQHIPHRPPARV